MRYGIPEWRVRKWRNQHANLSFKSQERQLRQLAERVGRIKTIREDRQKAEKRDAAIGRMRRKFWNYPPEIQDELIEITERRAKSIRMAGLVRKPKDPIEQVEYVAPGQAIVIRPKPVRKIDAAAASDVVARKKAIEDSKIKMRVLQDVRPPRQNRTIDEAFGPEKDEEPIEPKTTGEGIESDKIARERIQKARTALVHRARRQMYKDAPAYMSKKQAREYAKEKIPNAEAAAEYLDEELPGGPRPKLAKREKRQIKADLALWSGPGLIWWDGAMFEYDASQWGPVTDTPYGPVSGKMLAVAAGTASRIVYISPGVIRKMARSFARRLMRGRAGTRWTEDIAVEFTSYVIPYKRPVPKIVREVKQLPLWRLVIDESERIRWEMRQEKRRERLEKKEEYKKLKRMGEHILIPELILWRSMVQGFERIAWLINNPPGIGVNLASIAALLHNTKTDERTHFVKSAHEAMQLARSLGWEWGDFTIEWYRIPKDKNRKPKILEVKQGRDTMTKQSRLIQDPDVNPEKFVRLPEVSVKARKKWARKARVIRLAPIFNRKNREPAVFQSVAEKDTHNYNVKRLRQIWESLSSIEKEMCHKWILNKYKNPPKMTIEQKNALTRVREKMKKMRAE